MSIASRGDFQQPLSERPLADRNHETATDRELL